MSEQQKIDEARKLQADEIIDASTNGRTLEEVKQIAKNWCTTALQETCNAEYLRGERDKFASSQSTQGTDFKVSGTIYPELGKLLGTFDTKYEKLRHEVSRLLRDARADAVQQVADFVAPKLLRSQVTEFHQLFDQPVLSTPQVPADDRVRLRLRLIAEEFFELLAACGMYPAAPANYVMDIVKNDINTVPLKVDLVELADACGDLDYVVEGTRLEFGINGAPIAAEIHRSNMSKKGATKRADGKIIKPSTWTAPDIAGELKKQGWVP